MGQKVNPVGFRLGVNRGWDSVWYAKKKDFGNYLIEDFKIREYIKKNVINSGVSKVMIERTSNKCYVTIYTSRPGFVIGKKGSDIDKIKNNLSKLDVVRNIASEEDHELIKVNDKGIIEDAKFKTYGCGSAIASSSLLTEWVKGKSLTEASLIKNTDIAEELALPPVKIHCSVLAEDAISAAIDDYKKKRK